MVKIVMYLDVNKIKDILLNKDHFRIVFLGDSITSTEWVHPNWREIVEYVLKDKLTNVMGDWKIPSWKVRGINCGFDGSTSLDHLERLESEVLDYKPDLIISLFGGNDLYFGISPKEHKENIIKLINKIKAEVPYLIFCSSIACGKNETIKNKEYLKYVEELKNFFPIDDVLYIDLYNKYAQFELNKFYTFISEGNEVVGIKTGDLDFLHPNQLGNAYIAKIILEDGFGIEFDPEKYIRETAEGKMFPGY
jgi:lysophospholipase L1-like esterase